MSGAAAPGFTRVGRYVVQIDADRLLVHRRPGLLARLGLRENRPILSILGFDEVRNVTTSRRRLRAPELKRPGSARPWEVRILGRDHKPLCRALRFRSSQDAELFADLVRSFAAGTRA